MRHLEGLYLFWLALTLVSWYGRAWLMRPHPVRWTMPAIALAIGLAHVLTEGARWQLWPAYALGLILLAASLRPVDHGLAPRWQRRLRLVGYLFALFGVLGGAAALAALLPVPEFPTPPGPYQIGTFTVHWVDEDREEHYTDAPGDPREIMVQFWYPAKPGPDAEPAPFMPQLDAMLPALAKDWSFPPFIFSHLRHARSNAYEGAKPAAEEGPFPVLIYSHGWTGFRQVALNQIERLASMGYVVAAPDHTHGSVAVVFPGDRVTPNTPSALPPRSVGEAKRQRAIETLVDVFREDIMFILARLREGQAGESMPGQLEGMLDLDRVGLWGHSTGGGAVTEAAALHDGIKAAAALDPWVEPTSSEVREGSIAVPYLSILSEGWLRWRGENNQILEALFESARGPVYDLYLRHSEHGDFTALPLLWPVGDTLPPRGRIRAAAALDAVDSALAAFFETHLRGAEQAPVLTGSAPQFPALEPAEGRRALPQ